MGLSKLEIIEQLKEKGIEHDPGGHIAKLRALLNKSKKKQTTPSGRQWNGSAARFEKKGKPDPDRKRWNPTKSKFE